MPLNRVWPTSAITVITAAGAVAVTRTVNIVVIKKTVGEATAVTLPASPVRGRPYTIKDGKGDAATNAITVSPAAGTIDGAASFVINFNWASFDFVYNGTEWNII